MVDVKKPSDGKFKKGKSGNPNGRPPNTGALDKRVEKLMTEEEIVFEGDPLAYMAKHAEALSKLGQHKLALQLVEKIMPYCNPKMSTINASSEDNEIVIRFETPEE